MAVSSDSSFPNPGTDYDGEGETWSEESTKEKSKIANLYSGGSGLGDAISNAVDKALPNWLDDIPGWFISVITSAGKTLKRLLQNPIGYILYWFFKAIDRVLTLIFGGFYRLAVLVVGLVGFVFLGSDLSLGTGGTLPDYMKSLPVAGQLFTGNQMGIADIPVYVANSILIPPFESIGKGILAPINSFNEAVAAAGQQAGLAGPPLVFGLQIAELAAGLYVLSLVLEAIVGYVSPALADRLRGVFKLPLKVIR